MSTWHPNHSHHSLSFPILSCRCCCTGWLFSFHSRTMLQDASFSLYRLTTGCSSLRNPCRSLDTKRPVVLFFQQIYKMQMVEVTNAKTLMQSSAVSLRLFSSSSSLVGPRTNDDMISAWLLRINESIKEDVCVCVCVCACGVDGCFGRVLPIRRQRFEENNNSSNNNNITMLTTNDDHGQRNADDGGTKNRSNSGRGQCFADTRGSVSGWPRKGTDVSVTDRYLTNVRKSKKFHPPRIRPSTSPPV